MESVYKFETEELLDLHSSVEEINRIFAEVGHRLAVSSNSAPYYQLDHAANVELGGFSLFTVSGLLEILGDLCLNKASGIEGIPTSILFMLSEQSLTFLLKFATSLLKLGSFLVTVR